MSHHDKDCKPGFLFGCSNSREIWDKWVLKSKERFSNIDTKVCVIIKNRNLFGRYEYHVPKIVGTVVLRK